MVTEEKRKKTKIILGTQSKAQAGTGNYHCSTVINYDSFFFVGERFCFQLLFTT